MSKPEVAQYPYGRAVADTRREAGMTQPMLCEALGWDQPTLSAMENGKRRLYAHELETIFGAIPEEYHGALVLRLDAIIAEIGATNDQRDNGPRP